MGKLTHRTAPSCTYFVTTNTWQKRALFDVRENASLLLESLLKYRIAGAYSLHEFVIMPDHLHLLLTPAMEYTLERAMQLIKGGSSHSIHIKRGHRIQIWQPGFHEWTIRNSEDYRARQQYIWRNPIIRHLILAPEQWIFSSASGRYALDPTPEKLMNPSEAKAQTIVAGAYVGAKAPTP